MTLGTGLRRKQKKKRGLAVVLVIFVLIGIAAGWRLFEPTSAVEKLKAYFSTAIPRSKDGEAVRGIIYDRNYKELAVSLPRVSVFARPREMVSVEQVANELAPLLNVDEESILEKLRSGELRTWLVRDITQKQEDAIRAADISGVYLHREYSRYYPQKSVAAHLIGFVQDDIGLSGVEYTYDRLVQKMLGQQGGGDFHGGAGQHLVLSVDLKIQGILEQLVEDVAAGRQHTRVGAYAMDAGSGALVAAIQFPSFDPNRYRIYSHQLLESMLVRPMLLPPLFRAILRDSASLHSQYEARGQAHPWSISGQQLSLGSELRLWEKLGLAAAPPQDFGNSEKSVVKTAEYVVVGSKGQKDFGTVPEALSPLRLLAALSSLTNGGRLVDPYVVQSVVDPENDDEFLLRPDVSEARLPEVLNVDVSREIAKMMAMQGASTEMGGLLVHDRIAAEVADGTGYSHISNLLYYAAVPGERTELTLLLTIQGGSANIPVKQGQELVDPAAALAAVLPRIAVLQQVGKSIVGVAEPAEDTGGNYPVQLEKVREVVRSSLGPKPADPVDPGVMPNLVGLSLRKSLRQLQNSTCRIVIYGTGRVVSQEPAANKPLAGVKECVLRMQKQEDVSLEALEEKTTESK